ncbi:MAG: universal stress protein [bacterium]
MTTAPFKKLGLALTFSPSMQYNLETSLRLKKLFDAELCIIHSAEHEKEDKERMEKILIDSKCDLSKIKILSQTGNPAKVILKIAEEEGVDLLIAGALQKENLLKHYVGSVSRKLMNEAKCSVLILKKSKEKLHKFNRFCVVVDFSTACEKAIITSYQFAEFEKSQSFSLIRDLWIPGLTLSNMYTGSIEDIDETKKEMIVDESEKMNLFIVELNLSGSVPIHTECFYEKNALNLSNFVRNYNSDILVLSTPAKKTSIFNRIIVDEFKNIYEDLPSNLLIIRKN